jgi:hypothetical protein
MAAFVQQHGGFMKQKADSAVFEPITACAQVRCVTTELNFKVKMIFYFMTAVNRM